MPVAASPSGQYHSASAGVPRSDAKDAPSSARHIRPLLTPVTTWSSPHLLFKVLRVRPVLFTQPAYSDLFTRIYSSTPQGKRQLACYRHYACYAARSVTACLSSPIMI